MIPDAVYDNPGAVAIQMYNGSKPWGGMILRVFDPKGKLKQPGGQVTRQWFPGAANLKIGNTWNSIKVKADIGNVLTEVSKSNNSLTNRLKCGVIGTRCPGMDMISLGPTMENPHSPSERLYLPSVQKVWRLMVALLASFVPEP